MIAINKTDVYGWMAAIRGMRNPMNSWDRSDSIFCLGDGVATDIHGSLVDLPYKYEGRPGEAIIGEADAVLMKRLIFAGSDHAKFRRMINVSADITAPLYWWKEFDTYKVGTVANSCSTMHKIADKEFAIDDFSCEHLIIRDTMDPGDPDMDCCIWVDDILDWEDYRSDEIFCMNVRCDLYPTDILRATIRMLNTCREMYINTKDKKYWWQMIQLLPSSYNQMRTVTLNYEVLARIYHARKNHKLDEWRDFCKWIEELPNSWVITQE